MTRECRRDQGAEPVSLPLANRSNRQYGVVDRLKGVENSVEQTGGQHKQPRMPLVGLAGSRA